jgi:hypothetical protein
MEMECHMAGENTPVPVPTPLSRLVDNPAYQGGAWLLVDIDLSRVDSTPQRVNISLPRSPLLEIDGYAKAHGVTRSGFLSEAARAAMRWMLSPMESLKKQDIAPHAL